MAMTKNYIFGAADLTRVHFEQNDEDSQEDSEIYSSQNTLQAQEVIDSNDVLKALKQFVADNRTTNRYLHADIPSKLQLYMYIHCEGFNYCEERWSLRVAVEADNRFVWWELNANYKSEVPVAPYN